MTLQGELGPLTLLNYPLLRRGRFVLMGVVLYARDPEEVFEWFRRRSRTIDDVRFVVAFGKTPLVNERLLDVFNLSWSRTVFLLQPLLLTPELTKHLKARFSQNNRALQARLRVCLMCQRVKKLSPDKQITRALALSGLKLPKGRKT